MQKTVLLVNDDLIIKLSNGQFINYSPANKDLYNEVLSLSDDSEIEKLIRSRIQDDKYKAIQPDENHSENEKLIQQINALSNLDEFKVIDGGLYLNNAPFPIPAVLVEKFYLCLDNTGFHLSGDMIDAYEALKNFWYLCCLNPNERAREGMFEFLNRTGFKIMQNGMAMGYRRVVSNGIDSELVKFISNQYLKVRTIKKADPKNFDIIKRTWADTEEYEVEIEPGYYEDDDDEDTWVEAETETRTREITRTEYILVEDFILVGNEEHVGNLYDMYMRLPDLQYESFTDQYTKTFKIKIGEEVTMDRKDCDSNGARDCSRGLRCSPLIG